MTPYLGRKQTSRNADWLYAVEHIEELISRPEVDKFAAEAISNIRTETAGKRAAYAWSGGKDSIVLASLCEQAGVHTGFFAFCDLDYPAFIEWVRAHKPAGVQMLHTGYDLDWLVKHQDLIFAEGIRGQRWHQISQRGPFTRMFFENGLDMLIVGHRVMDGNMCGRDGFIRKKSGEVRYSPIRDWPHEALLGYIHYHGLELPPFYSWKDGYIQGTHAWPEREFCATIEQGYREIYEIDPSILYEAAKKLPSARRFLEKEVLA